MAYYFVPQSLTYTALASSGKSGNVTF